MVDLCKHYIVPLIDGEENGAIRLEYCVPGEGVWWYEIDGAHIELPEHIRIFLKFKIWNFLEVFTYGQYRAEKLLRCVVIRINSIAIESMDIGLVGKPKIIVKLPLSFENHHLEVRVILDFRDFLRFSL